MLIPPRNVLYNREWGRCYLLSSIRWRHRTECSASLSWVTTKNGLHPPQPPLKPAHNQTSTPPVICSSSRVPVRENRGCQLTAGSTVFSSLALLQRWVGLGAKESETKCVLMQLRLMLRYMCIVCTDRAQCPRSQGSTNMKECAASFPIFIPQQQQQTNRTIRTMHWVGREYEDMRMRGAAGSRTKRTITGRATASDKHTPHILLFFCSWGISFFRLAFPEGSFKFWGLTSKALQCTDWNCLLLPDRVAMIYFMIPFKSLTNQLRSDFSYFLI